MKQCLIKQKFSISLFQFMTLPIILAEAANILVLAQIGNGKSTAIAIAMSELVNISNSCTQILCFVHTSIAAAQMKIRMDLLNKYTWVTSDVIYTGRPLTSASAKAHILIGTPLEIAKVVLNDQIPVNRVRFVFFADADVTMKFDSTKSAIMKLSGFAKFFAFSSSVVARVAYIIPEVNVLRFCQRILNILSLRLARSIWKWTY